jgi:hypothetical protein
VALTAIQIELLECLQAAVRTTLDRQVVRHSEWLGWLPFGAYHWVVVNGKDFSVSLPVNWCGSDLEALAAAGFTTTLNVWQNSEDEWERRIVYEVKQQELSGYIVELAVPGGQLGASP